MTLKQLDSEIKRISNDLKDAKRNDKEMMELRGFSVYGKEIEYYTSRLLKLQTMRPQIESEEEEKILKRIAKQQLKEKASTIGYIQKGNDIYGVTPNGARWFAEHNWWGDTDRTKHCYTLRIGGKCLFTSGTLDTVLATVACS